MKKILPLTMKGPYYSFIHICLPAKRIIVLGPFLSQRTLFFESGSMLLESDYLDVQINLRTLGNWKAMNGHRSHL